MSEQKASQCFLGVNLDDTKVSAMAVSDGGQILAESSCDFEQTKPHSVKGYIEQSSETWWQSACHALGHLTTQLRQRNCELDRLKGISISSHPGSIAIINNAGESIYSAIMASDARGDEQAERLNIIGLDHVRKVGRPFRSTDAIAKIVWFKEAEPDLYENAMFVHQADYIAGKLKGCTDVTDPSLASTTGCDPFDNCWPDWLDYDMHMSVRERLPRFAQTGQLVGYVTLDAARSTGLPPKLPVIQGCNSQTAAFLSSGVKKTGDFYMIFDETMRIDGITRQMIHYPQNIVTMNPLPEKQWFFSTQSNTGTEWINVWFSEPYAEENIAQVDGFLPTKYLAFPNVRRGEIFPFYSNSAEGFISPATDNRLVQFAACIQGTTFIERMIYRKIDTMTENSDDIGDIYTFGPWCRSDKWMQCRADATERIVHRLPETHRADFGAAVVAAMGTKFRSLKDASESMVHIDQSFYPNPERTSIFKEYYAEFQTTMEEQGYLV